MKGENPHKATTSDDKKENPEWWLTNTMDARNHTKRLMKINYLRSFIQMTRFNDQLMKIKLLLTIELSLST